MSTKGRLAPYSELHLVYKRDYDHPRIFKFSEELAKEE